MTWNFSSFCPCRPTAVAWGAISHIYISPSSEEDTQHFCKTGEWDQTYPLHEEGQMWAFAQPFLLPKLRESFGAGNVVLAPNNTGPGTSVDAYPGRVADAIQLSNSTPGDWLYLAVHSNQGDPAVTPCTASAEDQAKGCCYSGSKYMSVLVHPTKSPFVVIVAETICKHLNRLRTDFIPGGYSGGACLVSKRTDIFELAADNGLAMPSVVLELGYHDTFIDVAWVDASRAKLSKAITDALLECKGGCSGTDGGGTAISHVYISPSSEEDTQHFCRTGGWAQTYPLHEEGQMWGFSQNSLAPRLKEMLGVAGVVLAPDSLGPGTSVDAYPTRVADAIQAQAASPGNWLYLAVHSDAGNQTVAPCDSDATSVAKGCCYAGGQHMSVRVHNASSLFVKSLATTTCKHLDALRYTTPSGAQGYRGSAPCQVDDKYLTELWELDPANGLDMPSMMLELGFHDSYNDVSWVDIHRTDLADAIVGALVECKDGCITAGYAIGRVYVSPSSEEYTQYFCRAGGPLQTYPLHEEGQMWAFSKLALVPKLTELLGEGSVVLAPDSMGPGTSEDVHYARVQDAVKTQKATPGSWVYLAVHSDVRDHMATPCNASGDLVVKNCCYDGSQHMSVRISKATGPFKEFVRKLAGTICKHLDMLRLPAAGSYGGSPCQVDDRFTTELWELDPGNWLEMPAVMLELGFQDSYNDVVWVDNHRTELAQAIADALAECKEGCPP